MARTRRIRKQSATMAHDMETPTAEQMANGHYTRQFITHVETATKAMAHIAATTPVERWQRDGRLSDSQLTAIALMRRLWAIAGLRQKTTATYGERLAISVNNEWLANTEIDARKDLHRIQDYIPRTYWDVFEQVCRHDEPAGVAGSRLGFGERSAKDRAHTIVCFVADVICMHERLA